MSYDETYRSANDVFGAGPERVLREHWQAIDRSRAVLDIGVGQGRNALFLAREGLAVDAIDPSRVAVESVAASATREELAVRTFQCDFEGFTAGADAYSGVLIFGLVQILSRPAIASLLERIARWTTEGSLVFVTGFTILDPYFGHYAENWTPVGRNSFSNGAGEFRTYLEPKEILEWFGGYTVVHHWEGMGSEHRHGTGPLERHGMAELVVKR